MTWTGTSLTATVNNIEDRSTGTRTILVLMETGKIRG